MGFGDSLKKALGRSIDEALQPPAKKQLKQAERGAKLAITVNLASTQINEALTVNDRTRAVNRWGQVVADNLDMQLVVVTSPTPIDEAAARAKLAALQSQQQQQPPAQP